MGKLRPERPTLAQKKAISRAGLLPDNWMVLDDGSVSMVILSRRIRKDEETCIRRDAERKGIYI